MFPGIKSYYKFIAAILLLALMAPSAIACRAFDVPVIRSSGSTSPHTTVQSDEFDETAIREATAKVVKRAADAVSRGDKKALMNELDESMREQVRDAPDLDLSLPQAKKLAQGLSDAKAVGIYPLIVFFEMSINSQTYSFYISKEDGGWKIGGL